MSKSVSFPTTVCCNCDSEESRYICRNCKESDRYLCFNCSILHPKIKAFKDHFVEPCSSSISNRDTLSTPFNFDDVRKEAKEVLFTVVKKIRNFVEYVYDIVSNRDSVNSTVYYQTVAIAVLSIVLLYSLLKAVFGSQAIIVVLILLYGYHYAETQANKEMKDILNKPSSISSAKPSVASRGLYKISQRKGFPVTSEKGAVPTYSEGGTLPASSIQISDDSEEFKNEFWHDMECRPAKFRPRGRSYKAHKSSDSVNEQKQ